MAAREFHGIIRNNWQSPLIHLASHIEGGVWQWDPGNVPGAGLIAPGAMGEWRSESSGIMTGTSGWALWSVAGFQNPNEFVRVEWSVPWIPGPDSRIVTCAVSVSDPRESFQNPGTPELELAPEFVSSGDSPPALAQAAYLAPYVMTIPFSYLIHLWGQPQEISHPRITFVLRDRSTSTTSSRLQFPEPSPVATPEQLALQSFVHRSEVAARQGYLGAFPNFYVARRGPDEVGGTILLSHNAGVWRDVPLAELGVSLTSFGDRMRATNAFASRNGFVGGFPTGYHADYGQGTVCGTVLLRGEAAEWRDVYLNELGMVSLDDIAARFRATHDYAVRAGFVGGFPNMFHAQVGGDRFPTQRTGTVCGTVLIKPGFGEWQDVVVFQGPR